MVVAEIFRFASCPAGTKYSWTRGQDGTIGIEIPNYKCKDGCDVVFRVNGLGEVMKTCQCRRHTYRIDTNPRIVDLFASLECVPTQEAIAILIGFSYIGRVYKLGDKLIAWSENQRLYWEVRGPCYDVLVRAPVHKLRSYIKDGAFDGNARVIDVRMCLSACVTEAKKAKTTNEIYDRIRNMVSHWGPFVSTGADFLPIANSRIVSLRTGEDEIRTSSNSPFSWSLPSTPSKTTDSADRFFLSLAGGDQELCDYMQVILGYCITGHNTMRRLFSFHGRGPSSGKSSLVSCPFWIARCICVSSGLSVCSLD